MKLLLLCVCLLFSLHSCDESSSEEDTYDDNESSYGGPFLPDQYELAEVEFYRLVKEKLPSSQADFDNILETVLNRYEDALHREGLSQPEVKHDVKIFRERFLIVACGLAIQNGHPPETLDLYATFRWFENHPDFENQYPGGSEKNIVGNKLRDGKPVYTAKVQVTRNDRYTTHGEEEFNEWYSDKPSPRKKGTISKTLTLKLIDKSKSQYDYTNSEYFPVNKEAGPSRLNLDYQYKGHPKGFPDIQYNYNVKDQRFSFTTHIHTRFTYKKGAECQVFGDDDIWVFVDDTMAVDLGGIHAMAHGSFNLNSWGLVEGQEYNFDVFHAERHSPGSSFKLTCSHLFDPCLTPFIKKV